MLQFSPRYVWLRVEHDRISTEPSSHEKETHTATIRVCSSLRSCPHFGKQGCHIE